jgi:antirestriction protein ArdC
MKVARTVLRGVGCSDASRLPDQALGGNVRKGETGTTICYADRFTPKAEQDAPITQASDEHRRQVAFLKRFTVFNVDQCEGLPDTLSVGGGAFLGERETIACAESLMAATGAQIGIGGDQAFYMPSADRIQLPPQQSFYEQVNFYRTALHELGHNAATRIMPRRPRGGSA